MGWGLGLEMSVVGDNAEMETETVAVAVTVTVDCLSRPGFSIRSFIIHLFLRSRVN